MSTQGSTIRTGPVPDADGGNAFEIDETLEELEAAANDDHVTALLDIIRHQNREIRRLRAADRRHDDRLIRVEANIGLEADDRFSDQLDARFDHRDREVLAAIADDEPETISLRRFQSLYRKLTDVRNPNTMEDRIRHLTNEGPFEFKRNQTWEYTGIPTPTNDA